MDYVSFERGHCKSDLPSSSLILNRLRLNTRGHCIADMTGRPVKVLYDMINDDCTLLVTNNYVVRMFLMVSSAHSLQI